jgi:hypothetical protein
MYGGGSNCDYSMVECNEDLGAFILYWGVIPGDMIMQPGTQSMPSRVYVSATNVSRPDDKRYEDLKVGKAAPR